MDITIKDLFTQEEWDFLKENVTRQIQEIADFPLTIDCEEL